MNHLKNNQGFTLVEIIAVLVLVGIMSTLAGMGIVQMTKGYVFTRENAETTQKGQLAMTRLMKEFTFLKSVAASSQNSITYTFVKAGVDVTRTVTLFASQLQIDNNTLTDKVSQFNLAYYNAYDAAPAVTWTTGTSRIIEITLGLIGAEGIVSTFKTRVVPRN